MIRACNLAYMIVSTSIIMWLVLTVHTNTGGELSTGQVFTTLSLLTALRLSSYFFVLALLGYSEGHVAIHRIQVHCTVEPINVDSLKCYSPASIGGRTLLIITVEYLVVDSLMLYSGHFLGSLCNISINCTIVKPYIKGTAYSLILYL